MNEITCNVCGGSGRVKCYRCKHGYVTNSWGDQEMCDCDELFERECKHCKGTGSLEVASEPTPGANDALATIAWFRKYRDYVDMSQDDWQELCVELIDHIDAQTERVAQLERENERMEAALANVPWLKLTDVPAPTLEARLASGNRTIAPDELNEAITLIVAGKVRPIEGVDYVKMPDAPTLEAPGDVHVPLVVTSEIPDISAIALFGLTSATTSAATPSPLGDTRIADEVAAEYLEAHAGEDLLADLHEAIDAGALAAATKRPRLTKAQRVALQEIADGTFRFGRGKQVVWDNLKTMKLVTWGDGEREPTDLGRAALAALADATPKDGER